MGLELNERHQPSMLLAATGICNYNGQTDIPQLKADTAVMLILLAKLSVKAPESARKLVLLAR
jgi:hypothetical protein